MLKITQPTVEPVWIDLLPDVRVRVKPPTPLAVIASRTAAGEVYRRDAEAPEGRKNPDVGAEAGVAMTVAYAKRVITAWEGVGGEDGEAAPATPENIEAAMGVFPFFQAFDDKVMIPALAREPEKNASSSGPGGGSGAAPNTAAPAS